MNNGLINLSGNDLVRKILEGERDFSSIILEHSFNINLHEAFEELDKYLKQNHGELSSNPINICYSQFNDLNATGILLPHTLGVRANFEGGSLYGTDLWMANFSGATFDNVNLEHVNLEGAVLNGAIFLGRSKIAKERDKEISYFTNPSDVPAMYKHVDSDTIVASKEFPNTKLIRISNEEYDKDTDCVSPGILGRGNLERDSNLQEHQLILEKALISESKKSATRSNYDAICIEEDKKSFKMGISEFKKRGLYRILFLGDPHHIAKVKCTLSAPVRFYKLLDSKTKSSEQTYS